jgi:hypothetical protein
MVYFIAIHDYVKIGMASDVSSRFRDIKTASPYPVRLLGYMDTHNDKVVEKEIQNRFATLHHRGEWYHLTPELLEYIHDHKDEHAKNVVEQGQILPASTARWVAQTRTIIDSMRSSLHK